MQLINAGRHYYKDCHEIVADAYHVDACWPERRAGRTMFVNVLVIKAKDICELFDDGDLLNMQIVSIIFIYQPFYFYY